MKTDSRQITVSQLFDGLALYAIERQTLETHQPRGLPLNPEWRNSRTRELIRGIADLSNLGDKAESIIKSFDDRLQQAQCCSAVETSTKRQQYETVQGLLQYAKDLVQQPYDMREQLLIVKDHFEDMAACLSWDASGNGLYPARDWLDRALARMTAQQNILFTHVILGSERGPAMSDFISGAITNAVDVANTCLYDDFSGQYPEVEMWPALCTVYCGGYGQGNIQNATEHDLSIMRQYGDSFLDLKGVIVCHYPIELSVIKGQQRICGNDSPSLSMESPS
jgi:hypothetical protein